MLPWATLCLCLRVSDHRIVPGSMPSAASLDIGCSQMRCQSWWFGLLLALALLGVLGSLLSLRRAQELRRIDSAQFRFAEDAYETVYVLAPPVGTSFESGEDGRAIESFTIGPASADSGRAILEPDWGNGMKIFGAWGLRKLGDVNASRMLAEHDPYRDDEPHARILWDLLKQIRRQDDHWVYASTSHDSSAAVGCLLHPCGILTLSVQYLGKDPERCSVWCAFRYLSSPASGGVGGGDGKVMEDTGARRQYFDPRATR